MNSLTLQSQLRLPCGASIPNRLGKSAMTEGLADPMDNATELHQQLYKRWSQGGAGLHISGNIMIDRRYLERAGNIVLEDERGMSALQKMVDHGKTSGNQFWAQISHPGRQCPRLVNGKPVAPSDVQLKMMGNFSRPRMLTETEIENVIERFTTTALLCKQAGFTGVQIHCAHGYLISQFLNPLINQRNDKWGGSLENRARLARRVITAVRHAVGDEFPVSAKLNSSDFQKGGFSLEESVQVAEWLAQDSLDLLEISGGNYEQLSLMGVAATEVRDSTRKREAYFLEYANAIRSSACIPLMVTGGFRNRQVMEQAIANGEADIIGLARPFCTQPNLPKLLLERSIDEVDFYETNLVLGKGFWGNNSSSKLIKAINNLGAVGFYYWQIIRLANNEQADTSLTVFRSFLKHSLRDLKTNMARKQVAKNPTANTLKGDTHQRSPNN